MALWFDEKEIEEMIQKVTRPIDEAIQKTKELTEKLTKLCEKPIC